MINEKIYVPLRSYFRDRGIAVKDIAETLGTNPVYISSILNGKKSIGRATAAKLADKYGFSIKFILSGEGALFSEEAIEKMTVPYLLKKMQEQEVEMARLKQEISNLSVTLNRHLGSEQNVNALKR